MRNRSAAKLVFAVIALMALVMFSFLLPSGTTGAPKISLPGTGSTDISVDILPGSSNAKIIEKISIDRKNVKTVIDSLDRPNEYSCTAQSMIYYSGGITQVNISVWKKDALAKVVEAFPNRETKSIILASGKVYIWGNKNNRVYQGKAGDFSLDDVAHMPTYENVLKYDDDEILGAELIAVKGINCILVWCDNIAAGLTEKYYVSIDNGLLMLAEFFSGETPTYKYDVTTFSGEPVSNDNFKLPLGQIDAE